MGVLEVNASMGLIVAHRQPAHPVLFQVSFWHFRKNMISPMTRSSTHSSHVLPLAGLAMLNATVAGAVGGCQAEIGVLDAMAVATLLSELMGGTPEQCTDPASTVLYEHVGSCSATRWVAW